jgi:rhamnogalacturonyl hydrolase YesR
MAEDARRWTVFGLSLALVFFGCFWTAHGAAGLDARDVRATIRRVADWQLEHPTQFSPRHWAMAPLYDGLIDASLVTDDPRYLAAVVRVGRLVLWQPGPKIYHADDLAAGHAWLRIYLMQPKGVSNSALLEPFKQRFDEILAKPIPETLSFSSEPRTPGVEPTDRWTWADALYMAPPTLALLARATGDERYLKFLDSEFRATYQALFDPQEKLFYRDSRFIDRRTPNGQKIFWSRGNAWVYAGLALMLDVLPADYATRHFYLDVFRQMSWAVLSSQQPDGYWYPSLRDPQHVPVGETSGSALFVLGLAWGVRHGVLDDATYWPAVVRGWNAIITRIGPTGATTFVQPIGAAPEVFDPSTREAYGTGAVLMAGSEILRALGGAARVDSAKLLAAADPLTAPDLSAPPGRSQSAVYARSDGAGERDANVRALLAIASPVLEALSRGDLKKRLPIHDWEKQRAAWTHYEAFARTLAGIAPWLALGPDDTPEGLQRTRFIGLARRSLINATDPTSPDYMNFGQVPDQPLVESAYLSYALLTARRQLWEPLDGAQRKNVLDALQISRRIKLEHNNNWLLFPAMIEAAFWQLEGKADVAPIETAVRQFQKWYVGDGTYSDGPTYTWDYYNSFAIQPMLLEILRVAAAHGHPLARLLPITLERARRYAEIQERLISPEGTFPVIGRSEAYRFGAFFHLAYMALHKDLPAAVKPSAARGGITTAMRRMIEAPGTFDENGWLRLGVVGFQPGVQETYNATGSLYMCLLGLVHLGLPADDPYWTDPPVAWTQQRIWSGQDVSRDRSLERRNGEVSSSQASGRSD